MPRRTIYVSEEDNEMFALLAKDKRLSAVLSKAVRDHFSHLEFQHHRLPPLPDGSPMVLSAILMEIDQLKKRVEVLEGL